MSQVTEQSVRFQTALASIKLIQASAVLDLTEDDFDFLTSNKVWIATDRSRARRCVEACVYGTLDFVGYPRFPAPVEFIAAVIAYYVHPVNIQTACLIMEGAEFTENIINGRSEERFSRNAETDLVCRLLLEKKKRLQSASAWSCRTGCRSRWCRRARPAPGISPATHRPAPAHRNRSRPAPRYRGCPWSRPACRSSCRHAWRWRRRRTRSFQTPG